MYLFRLPPPPTAFKYEVKVDHPFEGIKMKPSKTSIFKLLHILYDPEIRKSLPEAGLVEEEKIKINEENGEIFIPWKPTQPRCPLVPHISAAIKEIVEWKFPDYTVQVRIMEGTPLAGKWNKKLGEKDYLKKVGDKLTKSKMWTHMVRERPDLGIENLPEI